LSDVVGETPPYGRKFDQAERHIEVLEAILSTFVQRHPTRCGRRWWMGVR
jgi:hypothetical protein